MVDGVSIWADDKLGRREDARYLSTFLRERSAELVERGTNRAFVLNLDADWGAGKTFFLERFKQELDQAGHIAVYVNAWEDDFADDPLIAVMAAIDQEISTRVDKSSRAAKTFEIAKKAAMPVAREVGKGLLLRGASMLLTAGVTAAIGAVVAEAKDAIENEELAAAREEIAGNVAGEVGRLLEEAGGDVAEFIAKRQSIADFRAKLAAFIVAVEDTKDIAAPFFVLIDELDRCRPPYAIAMLERVKHLFETPRVVFVVATDSNQLAASVQAVYGPEFSGRRYLKRFFDHAFSFERPSTEELVCHLFATSGIEQGKLRSPLRQEHTAFVAAFFAAAKFDIRSIMRIFGHLHTVATTWTSPVKLELLVLLPLLATYYENRSNLSDPVSFSSPLMKSMAPEWRIYYGRKDARGNTEPHSIACVELAKEVWDLAQGNLFDADAMESNGNQLAAWKLEVFREEFQIRFNRVFKRGKPMPSVILSYPKIVRQAGRIDKVEDGT